MLLISALLCTLFYNGSETTNYRLYNSIFYVFYIFCQQSAGISPRSWASRLIHFTTHITFLIVFIAYSANFISHLTVQRSRLPFSDFQGLLDDGTYGLGVVYNNAHEDYLKNSKDPVIRDAYRTLVEPKREELPRHTLVGLSRLCDETKYSFFCSKITASGSMQNLSCNIIEIKEMSYRITLSFVINKKSPYKRFFNRLSLDLKSTGIIDRTNKAFWPPIMEKGTNEHHTLVTLDMVSIVYVMWAAGVSISVLILCLERRLRART
ncbi:glutamate receptor 2-like isoform X1 [Zootermopsis nevadensis]|nr:glutamate receptor 2-like isoform X1 [Zootermopsis nevadensis]